MLATVRNKVPKFTIGVLIQMQRQLKIGNYSYEVWVQNETVFITHLIWLIKAYLLIAKAMLTGTPIDFL